MNIYLISCCYQFLIVLSNAFFVKFVVHTLEMVKAHVVFQNVFGYIFMPLAWAMGVVWEDCHEVGVLIGLKTIVNEFVAYAELARMTEAGELSVSQPS